MTTCPRCGREADDEFVCPGCGAFLAGGGDDTPGAQVSVRRVALLVLIVCLLGAVGAVLLLGQGGGGHPSGLPGSLTSTPVELSTAPLGQPPGSGQNPSDSSGHRSSASSPATSTAGSSSSASKSAHRSSSAAASSSARSTPTTPHSSSHPSTSRPPSSPPPPTPSVQLAQSGSAVCGPHCYALIVTLNNFSAGPHNVSCFSGHAGQFGGYTTSSVTSNNCVYDHPHDTVWVVVDGHRSNTVSW